MEKEVRKFASECETDPFNLLFRPAYGDFAPHGAVCPQIGIFGISYSIPEYFKSRRGLLFCFPHCYVGNYGPCGFYLADLFPDSGFDQFPDHTVDLRCDLGLQCGSIRYDPSVGAQ